MQRPTWGDFGERKVLIIASLRRVLPDPLAPAIITTLPIPDMSNCRIGGMLLALKSVILILFLGDSEFYTQEAQYSTAVH